MIKRFLLSVAQQAVEEFLAPRLDALRGEILSEIRSEMDARFGEIRSEMDARFGEVDKRFAQIDGRFAQIDGRFERIDERFAQIDQRFAQIDERFEGIEKRLDRMEETLKSHSDQLARLDQRVIDFKEALDVERRVSRLEAHAGLGKE